MKETLELMISSVLQECFGISKIAFSVETPKDLEHGDYMTNSALVVAKQLGKNPKEVAKTISEKLQEKQIDIVKMISIADPGFINFTLKPEFFPETVRKILEEKDVWGKSDMYLGKRILVEHSSPNLFKPFHIGHLMNNTIGESIVRLAQFSGATVTAISYPSDISLGIAKAIFIMLEDGEKLTTLSTMDERIAYLGDCYVRGTKRFDEDETIQSRVREIAAKLYDAVPGPELIAYTEGKELNLEYFKKIVARLGSHFDAFLYESEAGMEGKKIIRENTPRIFQESDGAVIYPGENDGLHTRVFINKEGYPTYEAKDIGLLSLKFARFAPDISIFITDTQQAEYFKVVLAAAEKINMVWKEKSIHRTHGRMSFGGQKMSSRLGNTPLATDILEMLNGAIEQLTKDRKEYDVKKEGSDSISIAALKFSILRTQAGKNIDFDLKKALSFEGDSGPYLQYAIVRARSILAKAGDNKSNAALPQKWSTIALEKIIIHFPEIVDRSIREWAPHHVVGYLLELAQAFNSWYGNTKIIDATDLTSPYKLALTESFVQTMQNGLYLLGITVPEKM